MRAYPITVSDSIKMQVYHIGVNHTSYGICYGGQIS